VAPRFAATAAAVAPLVLAAVVGRDARAEPTTPVL